MSVCTLCERHKLKPIGHGDEGLYFACPTCDPELDYLMPEAWDDEGLL